MKMRRIISVLCLVSIFTECVPVNFANAASKKIELSQDIDSKKLSVLKETDSSTVVNNSIANNDFTNTIGENNIIANKLTGKLDLNVNEDNKGKIDGFRKVRVYVGDEFNYRGNIIATDSNGNDITDSVAIEGEVDTSTPGEYKLIYSASDESGETYTLERYVTVVEKNEFNIFTESLDEESDEKVRNSLFSISLDNETSKFIVYNQSSEPINPDKEEEVIFKMRVLSSDNKEKLSLELLGKDTGDSEKFDALKELDYSYGDFLEINPMEFMSEGFNIEGPIFGDVKVEDEDYSDGVDNADYISNVRFKIEEDGIYSVYNKAPEIKGLAPMDSLLKGRKKQLEGISITDDYDGNIENKDINIYEEKDSAGNVIGLRYEVSDSWGRTVSKVRYLKSQEPEELQNYDEHIMPANDESLVEEEVVPHTNNNNSSSAQTNVLSNNVITVKGYTYGSNNSVRFKIKFNSDNNKIEIFQRDARLFDNKITDKYFELKLYNSKGALKNSLTLNGNERADSKKIDDFNNSTFEFGDQIHIYHRLSESKLTIDGTINKYTTDNSNQPIDFTTNDGIAQEKLESARFELTKEGMRYLVNNPPNIYWNNKNLVVTRGKEVDLLSDIIVTDDIDKNIKKSTVSVTPYNPNRLGKQTVTYSVKDSWGAVGTKDREITVISDGALANTHINVKNASGSNTVFSIGFDDVDKKLLISNNTSDEKLDSDKPNDTIVTIKIISKAGITRKEVKLNGNTTGTSSAVTALNDYKYTVGDYIELWSPNYEKNLNIQGEIGKDSYITEDYSNGIKNEDFIKNVRFKITSDVLYAEYNKAPKIIFENNLTIKRGETFDPLNFVNKIEDDHDNLNKNLIKYSYNEDEFDKVGKHKVTYTVSDKRGRTTEETIEITVVEKNELEKNRIYFLNQKATDSTTSSAVFILSFDDVENMLNAEIKGNEFISGPVNGKAFGISIFNSEGTEKSSSVIKYNEQIDTNALSAILNEEIEYGDMINFYAYDYNKVVIEGSVFNSLDNHLGEKQYCFKSEDKIVNTRFKVTDNGLQEIYNEAPEIIGATDTAVMKNSKFNPLEGISIRDDHDKNLRVDDIKITGEVNTAIAGYQEITYTLTDSWGRTKEVKRKIFVKPLAENNKIILKNSEGQDAFVIGFDFTTMKFTVNSTTNSSVSLNPSLADEKVFSLTVRKPNGEVVNTLNLNGNDTGDSQKLKDFKETTTLMIGAQLSLWTNNSQNLRVEGHIIKPNDVPENYNDGIQDKEYMDNVRFVGTQDGMEVVYNKRPELTVPANTNPPYVLYKGDDYREKLLEGVSVTDPNQDTFDSGIGKKDIKIKLKKVISEDQNSGNNSDSSQEQQPSTISGEESSEDNSGENLTESEPDGGGGSDSPELSTPPLTPDSNTSNSDGFIELTNLNELGLYDVYYTAVDSWGRESIECVRRISFQTSIDRNIISFSGYNRRDHDYIAFKIGFDSTTMRMKLFERKAKQIHVHENLDFYTITLYGQNNEQKIQVTLKAHDLGTSNKLDPLTQREFAYGDYLTIYAFQSRRLSIDGPVRNEIEDYGDGVDMSDDFKYTRFYITESGLESKLVPEAMGQYDSLIEFIGTNGGAPFKMKFNHYDRSITYPSTNEFFNYNDKNINDVLKVNVKKDNSLRTVYFHGNDSGVKNELRQIFGNTDRGSFTDGDYLNFEYLNIPANIVGLRIQGNISEKNKNYTEKLISRDDAKNVRFYLRSNNKEKYLDPVYNYAPTFTTVIDGKDVEGLQDLNIYQDQVEAYNANDKAKLKEDVKVKDDIDTNKPHTEFNVSGPTLNGIGRYEFTYTATDSWGRETRVTRNVYVRPNVYKNKITLYPKDYSAESNDSKNDTAEENSSTKINIDSSETLDIEDASQTEDENGDSSTGGSDNSDDTSNSNGENSNQSSNVKKPAFEIVLDNYTHKYVVKNTSDNPINEALGNKPAFKITIYNGQNNSIRKTIELNGLDTGKSEVLKELNEVEFQYGDTIRVWAADAKSLTIDGDIEKNIKDETEELPHTDDEKKFNEVNYATGTDNQNYYKNVAFKTSETKLIAYYNKAPKINIPNLSANNELDILFGTTVNLRDGVTINDDRDTSLINSLQITGENDVNSNEISAHKVVYSVTDSWGRSTSLDVTVNIVSNMRENQINIYNEENLKFGLKFNTSTNKIEIVKNSTSQNTNQDNIQNIPENNLDEERLLRTATDGEDTGNNSETTEEPENPDNQGETNGSDEQQPDDPEDSGDSSNGTDTPSEPETPQEPVKDIAVRITVTNRNGEKKAEVTLSKEELNDINNLEPLTKINVFNEDIISFYAKGQKDIRILGKVKNNDNHNFTEGFGDLRYDDVKFKITNDGLDLIKYRELEIEFIGELTVNRGDEAALLDKLTLKYKDNSDIESLSNVQIKVEDINVFDIGVYTAKYIVTDVWGRKTESSRQVTVVEKNSLEHNRIVLKNINSSDNSASELMEFYIDTIQKRIITRRFEKNTYTGEATEEKTLIKLTLYDDTGRTKDSIEVTPQNLDNIKDRFISYDDGDLIGLEVYDYRNGFYIAGNIQGTIKHIKANYANGALSQDHVDNVRFKIIDDTQGVKAIYNNAPNITISGPLTIFKDESPDLYKGIKVSDTDEHDKELGVADVVIETNLDITRIGEYEAKYSVQDTWGRKTEVKRTITVKSSLMNNKIEFYRKADGDDSLFDITINLQEQKFVVTQNKKLLRKIRREANGVNESTNSGGVNSTTPGATTSGIASVNPNKPIEGVEYQFKLFDEDGKLKKMISISTDDLNNGTKLKEELDKFNNTHFEFGDYISVYAKLEDSNVRIKGNIDIPNRIKEDYSDGINEPDFMYNVRFKIKEDSMYAIYNEAPILRLLNPDEVIEVFCGDDHDYGAETEISDDHDLDIGSDKITISEEDKKNMTTLGKHKITLILTDSWGRSVSVDRTYNVKSSIDRNTIVFGGTKKISNGNYTNNDTFRLRFNHDTRRITMEKIDENMTFHSDSNRIWYYKIYIYSKDGINTKFSAELEGQEVANTQKLQNLLNGLEFEYGDYIRINAKHAFKVKIDGAVRNQLEDYSDGAQFGDDFQHTDFIITEAGLESRFSPETINDNESLIEFVGTNGGTPFKLKFNHYNNTISYPDTTEFYYYDAGNRSVFRVKYYNAITHTLTNYDSNGRDHSVKDNLKQALNGRFNDGDYFAFEYLDIPDSYYGLRITGKVNYESNADEELKNEDYSDGIQNKKNLTQVRFYLNKDGNKGITPVRVPAATIEGADDIDILQRTGENGESIYFDLLDGVKAIDSNGSILTAQIQVTGEDGTTLRTASNRTQLDVSRIGLYLVKYEVTNAEGIKTTVYRNIRVYTNATITLKNPNENIVMEQGGYATTEAQVQYLKQYATAQDIDTNPPVDISDKINVDVSKINIEQPGKYPVVYSIVNSYGKTSTLDTYVYVTRTINVSVPTTLPFQVVTNLIDKEADPFISGVLKVTNNNTSDVRVTIQSFQKEGEGNLEIVDPDTYDDWSTLTEAESMSKMALGIYTKSGFKEQINNNPDNGTNQPDEDTTPGDGGEEQNPDSGDSTPDNGSQTPDTDTGTVENPNVNGSTDTNESDSELALRSRAGSDSDESSPGNSNDDSEDETGTKPNDTPLHRDITWLIPSENQLNKFMGTVPRATSLTEPSVARLSFTSKHGKNFIGGTFKGRFRLVFRFE